MAISKLILDGVVQMDVTDTTADASEVKNGETFYAASGVKTTGSWNGRSSVVYQDTVDSAGGTVRNIIVDDTYEAGADLSFVASSTVTPSIRNAFYAWQHNDFEHGEFTLASTPTTEFITLFTMTNFSASSPPNGIMIVDKDFYQGSTTLPNNGNTDAIAMMFFEQSLVSNSRKNYINSEYPIYGGFTAGASQSNISNGGVGTISNAFDGTTQFARGYFLFDGNNLTWKSQFGGVQYTTFVAGRTYIWMVW